MPPEGHKTISASDALYGQLVELAKEEFTSVPRLIEKLVAEHQALKKKGGERAAK